ncbi:MAG TPA: PilN domain-containing protein [Elusimicrobiota bacterium]|nr:PilN domain-containing protein [Elusimicrobiota bacterium]
MIKINLIPQEILDRELQRRRTIQFGVAGAAFMVVLALVSLVHYTQAVAREHQLAKEKKDLESLRTIVAQVEQLDQAASAVRSRLGVIQDLLVGRPLYPYFMEDMVATFPPGVWISSLNTSPDGSGLKVSMAAKAMTQDDVSAWLRTLDSSTKFKEAVMGAISVDATGVASFSMTMKYTPELKAPA